MLYFVEIIFVIGLIGLVVLFAKKLPLLEEMIAEKKNRRAGAFSTMIAEWIHKVDTTLITFLEKILIKFKIILMKWYNGVSKRLDALKQKSESKMEDEQHILDELSSDKEQEKK